MNLTRNLKSVALAIAGVIFFPCCTASGGATEQTHFQFPDALRVQSVQKGKASWYSTQTNSGKQTASGRKLNNSSATAAHKTLPLGSTVRVTNLSNGKAEVVTITDRGPFIAGRIIDVSIGVAERLGFAARGVVPVKLEVLATPAS
ncbi:MAG: septal ring lytic transglycosylase RlpA family protein [Verrucomicrobia bacterium]|nr:MAG: septal ring lytic transglycosylase RlpA family protein [Verrucomicrobiota bacterium]